MGQLLLGIDIGTYSSKEDYLRLYEETKEIVHRLGKV